MRREGAMRRRTPVVAAFLFLSAGSPALAQIDGARVQWPLPKNLSVFGVHILSGTANATLTNLPFIQPSIDIDNQLYLLSYSRSQPVFGRSAIFMLSLPAGIIRTNSNLPVEGANDSRDGIGDPSLGVTINLIGAPGLMLREYARYDLGTAVHVGVKGTFGIGSYDSDEALNIGSNQSKLRLSLPVVRAFGPWVPGRRTTLEVTPSLTLIGDNDDAQGTTIDQDPMFAVEAHLSRDFTKRAFISGDYTFARFGETRSTDNVTGAVSGAREAASAHLLGVTVSFQVNDNLQLFLTHLQTTAEEKSPVALEGALLRVTLTWSWHPVIERRRDFAGN